jgi:hypothetical protein
MRMKKTYQIIRINMKDSEELLMGEFEKEVDAITKAEEIWEHKKTTGQGDFERVEVRKVTKTPGRVSVLVYIAWVSEWYDAMNEYGIVVSQYENLTAVENPRPCKVGHDSFYSAYGIDMRGNRYLIEWDIDKEKIKKPIQRPLDVFLLRMRCKDLST